MPRPIEPTEAENKKNVIQWFIVISHLQLLIVISLLGNLSLWEKRATFCFPKISQKKDILYIISQIILAFWLVLTRSPWTVWSIIGQTHRWRNYSKQWKWWKFFWFFVNILGKWAKDKVHRSLVETVNRYEKQEEERKISRQSSETNQNTKLVLKLL